MKILVFCSDLLPLPGLPTSGGGLRSWQMIASLGNLGHEIIVSMPTFTYLGRRFAASIPEEICQNAWTPENQDELVERHRPDAVLFTSSWIVDRLLEDHDCLKLYDLDGPMLLEMHYKGEREQGINAQAKVERLSQADFVFCAGQRQRSYFLPFLLLAGFSPEQLLEFPVVPMAADPLLPMHEPSPRIEMVTGGGFYPWQDPRAGLRAVCRGVEEAAGTDQVRLRIFGRSHGVTADDDRQFQDLAEELGALPFVEFNDFMPRDQLIEEYRRAWFAVELHQRNPERELAVTTRTIDFLWCGLPVLYNDYGELADLICQYDAGWTVDPADVQAIGRCVAEILRRPEQIIAKGVNAQQLVRERLTYPQAIAPLARFLESPYRRAKAPPAKVLPMSDYHRLLRSETEYLSVQGSRAWKAASTVSAWRRKLIGSVS